MYLDLWSSYLNHLQQKIEQYFYSMGYLIKNLKSIIFLHSQLSDAIIYLGILLTPCHYHGRALHLDEAYIPHTATPSINYPHFNGSIT